MSLLETKNKSLSRYEEVGQSLRERIESGRYRQGESIPTEMELMREYGVARSTVRQAIAVLEQQGYVARRRGVGTFVQQLCKQGKPIQSLKSGGYLLVDLPPLSSNSWATQATRAAHDILFQQNIDLSIAHVSTGELFDGRRPAILQDGACQAVLLDGWVTDAHCELMERMGMPYLVIGNARLQKRRPQVRYAFSQMAYTGTKYLYQLRPNQPVVMLVEPFQLYLTQELYNGYVQAAYELPQKMPFLLTAADQEIAVKVFARLFDQFQGPFSLLSNDLHWLFASMEYRRRNLSPVEWPILSVGNSMEYSESDRMVCHVMPASAPRLIGEALPRFIKAFEQGETSSFYLELMTGNEISALIGR